MEPKRKRLGEILIEMGVLTSDQLEAALRFQKTEGGFLGTVLIRKQFVEESDITIALAKQNQIPYLPLQQCQISKAVLDLIPAAFAHKNLLVPFDQVGHHLLVVFVDPGFASVHEEIEKVTGFKVLPYIGLETEVSQALKRHYKMEEGL